MHAANPSWIAVSSVKGGVGCSTVASGLAMESARLGRRVLLIDWNLKQPSLHRFVTGEEGELSQCRGVAGYLADAQAVTHDRAPIRIADYVISAIPLPNDVRGSIDLMPAGSFDRDYWNLVRDFSWDNFYRDFRGFHAMERLRIGALDEYDAILVDAGLLRDDAANVAVLQLADVAVLVFQADAVTAGATLNAAHQLREHPSRSNRSRLPLQCIAVPSRIDRTSNRFEEWLGSDVVRRILKPFEQSGVDVRAPILERRALRLEPSLSISQIDVRSSAFAELGHLRTSLRQILSEIA